MAVDLFVLNAFVFLSIQRMDSSKAALNLDVLHTPGSRYS